MIHLFGKGVVVEMIIQGENHFGNEQTIFKTLQGVPIKSKLKLSCLG